ncbi:serine O-acetyltransferase [Desulfobulbus oligotrophicus]|jgi:serine O-acetyltransferase|uniref:Serine acetyltransferase n=1 Tax=Desulfobulbus oligotrophicus TaxID=1909699 RepID=A0A7T6APX1_9BACT|nr:serine O-acetyltransferase [Desulfobulbus oligotrophicus]MDY0390002.1 serine O-acetyltransferase [Desulfobulbus oligotrophicus]QQG64968.1 serine acetyltransferase [Desulfobulbus oligotrophicus]
MPQHDIRADSCRIEAFTAERMRNPIPAAVNALVEGFKNGRWTSHIEPVPIPSKGEVIDLIEQAQCILFPGFFAKDILRPENLDYHLGRQLSLFYENLANQISSAIRHDCFRHNQACILCNERSYEYAAALIDSLPTIRNLLETDIEATLTGDPAAGNADEVIFSYPGLFATMIYRLAHRLYELNVPLIPRIMSEHAYHRTAIDINPEASIGSHFFIDHGAGVVVGATTTIGNRVRLYQGVTLGALSLPRDAGERLRNVKRHPTIEDDVIIYANATILGGATVIGARSIIGGNVWLTESVGPDTRVMLEPPKLVYIGEKGEQ